MDALTIATLAAALEIAAPAGPATDAPPDIVLLCKPQKPGGLDMRNTGPPETVMVWSKAGIMSWPRAGRDSRFPAQVQQGTIFFDEPLNGGRRVGHIDRDTGVYEEMTYVGDAKTETLGFGKCVVSTNPRKF
jgi:hypothetical protein